MSDAAAPPPPPPGPVVPRTSKPVSEALLNEKVSHSGRYSLPLAVVAVDFLVILLNLGQQQSLTNIPGISGISASLRS